jgi:hypothetical protein|tara:strand:+ start:647 stop:1504 length:858 start_codon:yes stop_codon:yes gene_type:complete
MSTTLKRPMFRKGGEVMEGVMTGIKPREMFQDKGMTDQMFKNVQQRINLIDAVAGQGASPLGSPLTQFLLTTGQNLIAGEAAGGSKLQEIVGATKKPLATAIKQQQLRDINRRKIAASVISKMGTGGLQKYVQQARDAFKFNPKLSEQYGGNVEKYALELFNQDRFRQGKSAETIQRESLESEARSIMKREIDRSKSASYFIESAAKDIAQAKRDLEKSPAFKEGKFNIDNNLYYVPPEIELTPGEKKGTFTVDDASRLEIGNLYYRKGIWYLYDGVTLSPKFRG